MHEKGQTLGRPRKGWTKEETGLQLMPENQQELLTKYP